MNTLSLRLLSLAKNTSNYQKNYLKFAKSNFSSSNPYENVPQFSSTYSLDKVYPKSSLNIAAASKAPGEQKSTLFKGYIPADKLKISYARSSGPGGQHVNTTNSKVIVTFHLATADWIPDEARIKLARIHKNSISKDGFWSIKSEKTRTQFLNLADCMDKLRCYITEASKVIPQPDIETVEMRREQAERAAEKRLRQKRMHSMKKEFRKAPTSSDL